MFSFIILIIILVIIGYIVEKRSKAAADLRQKRREEVRELQRAAIAERWEELMDKYGDDEIVERLMNKQYWQGGTTEHVIDALGHPVDVDTKVLKAKTKQVWKYNRLGKNRYALRIHFEQDIVVGWDEQ